MAIKRSSLSSVWIGRAFEFDVKSAASITFIHPKSILEVQNIKNTHTHYFGEYPNKRLCVSLYFLRKGPMLYEKCAKILPQRLFCSFSICCRSADGECVWCCRILPPTHPPTSSENKATRKIRNCQALTAYHIICICRYTLFYLQ